MTARATIVVVADRLAGDSTEPVVEMTTSALVPAVFGKRAAKRFCTCCDAELPEPNESWNRLPMDWATTVMTMIAADPQEQDPTAVVVAPARQAPQCGVLGLERS